MNQNQGDKPELDMHVQHKQSVRTLAEKLVPGGTSPKSRSREQKPEDL